MKNNLKKALEKASGIENVAERAVAIASVLSEALQEADQEPVLVGGSAVAFYTEGGYSTADIDMVSEGGPKLIETMLGLGFEKLGKDFVQSQLKIYVECPSRSLKPSEQTLTLNVDGRPLKIISPEDLMVDRLCAFKFWQSGIDGACAIMLLELQDLDESRLTQRALEEDVHDALVMIQKTHEEIIRKKLPKAEANRLLEQRMQNLK